MEEKQDKKEGAAPSVSGAGFPDLPSMGFSGLMGPVPGFSGLIGPNITVVPCPDCEAKNEPNTGGDYFTKKETQSISTLKIKPNEMKKLKKFLHDEEVAVTAAKAASRKRDLFCVDLERDYGLNGMAWTVDLEKGIIKITGKRPEK